MKQCPSCSTKNPDSARFCQNCGVNLDGVESIRADFSSTANEFFAKASGILGESAQKVKGAMATGVEKAKGAAETGREKVQNTVAAGGWDKPASSTDPSQLNGGWDNSVNPNEASSVTVKKYSFFQSDEEETIAVIGEQAAVSDLEGTYRGPYAVLTKERLYVKNENGNFIIAATEILSAKKNAVKPLEWIYWIAVVFAVFLGIFSLCGSFLNLIAESEFNLTKALLILCSLISTIAAAISVHFHLRNDLKKTSIALIFSIFLPSANVVCIAIYLYNAWKNRTVPATFSIHCVGSSFSFAIDNYPPQELQDFQIQISLLIGVPVESKAAIAKGNGAANICGSSYQAYQSPKHPSGRNGSPAVTITAIIVILAIIIFAGVSIFNTLTTCKVSGCGNGVYKDGYCTTHYSKNYLDKAAGNVFDFFSE